MKPQISPQHSGHHNTMSKNISKKGPWNRRSLGFARDDKERATVTSDRSAAARSAVSFCAEDYWLRDLRCGEQPVEKGLARNVPASPDTMTVPSDVKRAERNSPSGSSLSLFQGFPRSLVAYTPVREVTASRFGLDGSTSMLKARMLGPASSVCLCRRNCACVTRSTTSALNGL